MIIPFDTPVSFEDCKAVIKLLESTDEKLSLITDTKKAYGLGEVDWNSYDEDHEDLFLIEFKRKNKWVLSHGKKNKMMIVENGIPKLPTDEKLINKAKRRIENLFNEIDDNSKENILKLIRNIIEQKNGALLVISEKAKEEAKRLKNSSAKLLNPLVFNDPNLFLSQITNIDGAVFVDTFSNCLAIGVILDGVSQKSEDPSKGLRYNSAVRYVAARKEKNKDEKCMAIVISEDGDLNVIV
jgi:DNA integrity scanning protein DisA with diadenylate cyclase activity